MAEIPINLNALGITVELEEGQMIVDAVLIARVVSAEDSQTRLMLANTPGMDWIIQTGLIAAAMHADNNSIEAEE